MNLPITRIGLILVCLMTTNLALESGKDKLEASSNVTSLNETSDFDSSSNEVTEVTPIQLNQNETSIEDEGEESGNSTQLGRESRKIGGREEVEGRFFLKDKLCSLGLADVSFFLINRSQSYRKNSVLKLTKLVLNSLTVCNCN